MGKWNDGLLNRTFEPEQIFSTPKPGPWAGSEGNIIGELRPQFESVAVRLSSSYGSPVLARFVEHVGVELITADGDVLARVETVGLAFSDPLIIWLVPEINGASGHGVVGEFTRIFNYENAPTLYFRTLVE